MLNKIMIIGNLGSDPEMRYTPNGAAVTSFSVATNRKYKTSDGEQRDETVWFRVSAWNRLAEVTNEYLHKGSQVYVEGRIKPIRIYETQSGEARAELEINAQTVQFLSTPNSGNGNGYDAGEPVGAGAGQRSRRAAPQGREVSDDDLPW